MAHCPQPSTGEADPPEERVVRMVYMPPPVNDDRVKAFFSQFKVVDWFYSDFVKHDCQVVHVLLGTAAEAAKACQVLDTREIDHYQVRVFRALHGVEVCGEQLVRDQDPAPPPSSPSGSKEAHKNARQLKKIKYTPSSNKFRSNSLESAVDVSSSVVFVGNVHPRVNGLVIREIFSGYNVVDVLLDRNMYRAYGEAKRICFVLLSSPQERNAAVSKLKGWKLFGWPIFLDYSRKRWFYLKGHGLVDPTRPLRILPARKTGTSLEPQTDIEGQDSKASSMLKSQVETAEESPHPPAKTQSVIVQSWNLSGHDSNDPAHNVITERQWYGLLLHKETRKFDNPPLGSNLGQILYFAGREDEILGSEISQDVTKGLE